MKRFNRLKIYLSLMATAFAVSSCNFLDFDQSTGYDSAADVYETWTRTQQSLTHVYSYMESGFTPIGNAMRDCASDDATYVWSDSNIHIFGDSRWSAINNVDGQWSNYYTGIRAANSFIKNFEETDYQRYEHQTDYDTWMDKAQYWVAEARFLRALFHFELARRYGDIPLAKGSIYTVDDVNSLKKSPFNEVAQYIIEECDSIAKILPLSYTEVSGSETGRITRGAALALKSRIALYAASTTYNADAAVENWQDAAQAAHEVIELNQYSLHATLFPFDNFTNIIASKELILERRLTTSSNFEALNTSVSYEGGGTGACPSQNLVDAFETTGGYAVTYNESSLAWESEDPSFNPASPYSNRDARLAATILYDGSTWASESMECYEGGKDGSPVIGASETGYYLKKHLNPNVELAPIVKPAIHTWVLFRYAEVLLNYAEAMNEAYGVSDNAGMTMTALEALNVVRARAGQPAKNTNDQDELRAMIRNERRVELAFENQRFWDIRRWRLGEQTEEVMGVRITMDNTRQKSYTLRVAQTRTWEDKKYLYPLPISEIYNNPSLGQNAGW